MADDSPAASDLDLDAMRRFAEGLSDDLGPLFGRDVVRLIDDTKSRLSVADSPAASDRVCACGAPLVVCVKCGEDRCLNCDPYSDDDDCGAACVHEHRVGYEGGMAKCATCGEFFPAASVPEFVRPSEEEERRALRWLMDMRENGGPLDRSYARTVIETLAYFEQEAPVDTRP